MSEKTVKTTLVRERANCGLDAAAKALKYSEWSVEDAIKLIINGVFIVPKREINVSGDTGLTEEEQVVMDNLVAAFNAFYSLPRTHPSELQEFVNSIHRLQDLLVVRIVRRDYPDGWVTGEK